MLYIKNWELRLPAVWLASFILFCCTSNRHYETIISFMDEADWTVDAFIESLMSRRKKDKLCVNLSGKKHKVNSIYFQLQRIRSDLSLFFISKLRSTPSIKLLNHWAIVCCFSKVCDRMIFSFNELKTYNLLVEMGLTVANYLT